MGRATDSNEVTKTKVYCDCAGKLSDGWWWWWDIVGIVVGFIFESSVSVCIKLLILQTMHVERDEKQKKNIKRESTAN